MQGTLSHLKRWDTATLAWVVWDGSLTTGSLVIGAVTQSGTWTVTANAGTNLNTSALATQTTLASLLTELQAKADLGETQPVSLAVAPSTPVTGTFWQATQPVSIAATVTTKDVRAGTSAVTTVADNAASVTLLAANANRLGAVIFNDSSAALFLKLGATASSTSYTVRLTQYTGYEVPFAYTGVIDGIWASDPNDGAARIVELTA
mgnify:CR=1 FL=1